jgi:hypothetical protein
MLTRQQREANNEGALRLWFEVIDRLDLGVNVLYLRSTTL